MTFESAGIGSIWLCVLVAPPLALGIKRLAKQRHRAVFSKVFFVSLSIILLAMACAAAGIGFAYQTLSVFWTLACILSCALIITALLSIRPAVIGWIAYAIAALPFAAIYVLTCFVYFIVPSLLPSAANAFNTVTTGNGLICQTSYWGGFTSDSGFQTDVYRSLTWTLVLQKRVGWINIDQSNNGVSTSFDPAIDFVSANSDIELCRRAGVALAGGE